MKKSYYLLALIPALALTGCQSHSSHNVKRSTDLRVSLDAKQAAEDNELEQIKCVRERRLGTNRMVLKCETVAEIEANERATDRIKNNMMHQTGMKNAEQGRQHITGKGPQ